MVVYNLVCEDQHRFEGWFASAQAFDAQLIGGKVSCPTCGSRAVTRRPNAPYLNTRSAESGDRQAVAITPAEASALLSKLVDYVRHHTEDVGRDFPEQARKVHYGEIEPKAIRGTASAQEIAELHEEGIDVLTLPSGVDLPDKLQ